MKHLVKSLLLITIISVFFSSCGVNSGLTNQFSSYNSTTNVVLDNANFEVIGSVEGTATDTYIFGFGGLKQNLVAEAKQKMFENANLDGSSKAIVNITVERHKSFFLIGSTHTVVASGNIIEFKK